MLFATFESLMVKMKTNIKSEWEVTDLGEPTKIVGIEITKKGDSITLSQVQYIEAILRNQGMLNVNLVAMPLDPHTLIEPNPKVNEGSQSNTYAWILGELQYLVNAMRPNIAFAVKCFSSYTANRILQYLAGMKMYEITYSASPSSTNLFKGYSDATYKNTDDHKSMSSYVFTVGGGTITWMSRKQSTIVLSSTEAEYVALSEAGLEASWLRSLLRNLVSHSTAQLLSSGTTRDPWQWQRIHSSTRR